MPNAKYMPLNAKQRLQKYNVTKVASKASLSALVACGQITAALLNLQGRIVFLSSGAHAYARGKGMDFDDLEWKRDCKLWVPNSSAFLTSSEYLI